MLGVLGIQSQALARFGGRLKVGVVFARRHDERKPVVIQVVKEIRLDSHGENALGNSSPTNC